MIVNIWGLKKTTRKVNTFFDSFINSPTFAAGKSYTTSSY